MAVVLLERLEALISAVGVVLAVAARSLLLSVLLYGRVGSGTKPQCCAKAR
jgi:hypothetical protein